MTAPVNLTAVRGEARTQVKTASTGTTAHAVDFIAQATASTSAARMNPGRGFALARARVRQVSAMIGGSVTPTVSGKATSGEATEIAASTAVRRRQSRQPRTGWGEMSAKAAVSATTVTSEVQILGSPSNPGSPASRGRPNSSISGRYGL
jgi:hypothetical protein